MLCKKGFLRHTCSKLYNKSLWFHSNEFFSQTQLNSKYDFLNDEIYHKQKLSQHKIDVINNIISNYSVTGGSRTKISKIDAIYKRIKHIKVQK